MNKQDRLVEDYTLFSKSKIWELNRIFYDDVGVDAWSDNIVPHHMTSNSKIGKIYAKMILALLQDLAKKGHTTDTVYILELGAGHGRLAFHILLHLENLIRPFENKLAPYCYILSDIVEKNLSYFLGHPQLQRFYKSGKLDVAFFDAMTSTHVELRVSKQIILSNSLSQPIIAIGNYFFDSLPTDLIRILGNKLSFCNAKISEKSGSDNKKNYVALEHVQLEYEWINNHSDLYVNKNAQKVFERYKETLSNTHIFAPQESIMCIDRVKALSASGMLLLSMDKGFHELQELDNKVIPDIVRHGSMSVWVNFHAISEYCEIMGGRTLFPSQSTFHLHLLSMMYTEDHAAWKHVEAAYEEFIDDFGPDDLNSLKKMTYSEIGSMNVQSLLALLRLNAFDSTFLTNIFSQLRNAAKEISYEERRRIAQALNKVWDFYYHLGEKFDLPFEIGGLLFDLGFYQLAIKYFSFSLQLYGNRVDSFHNTILCYYQLNMDKLVVETLAKAKNIFPDNAMLEELEKLDFDAK